MEGAEYNAQTTLAGDLLIVMALEEPVPMDYAIIVNPFALNVVKTAQIYSSWYEENARIDLVQTNSDPPRDCISVGNESSPCMLSSLILCISFSQRILPPFQRWYTTATLPSTIYMHFKQTH